MRTPICDFVRHYAESDPLRLHMPGHKGRGIIGAESLDITEIEGADSLYDANGIISESEGIASELFGCRTFYSTEGSSQCIRAMLRLACLHARDVGREPRIAFGRNAHKTALTAAALLDVDPIWIYPERGSSYLSCAPAPSDIEALFADPERSPSAVYLTSPDYLGELCDVERIAEICHRNGALLLVDCAHGAYLKFLPRSLYPTDLGADLVCSSAHKTLPVLTGGAYLHISHDAPAVCAAAAREALALFGSTSPSYLILQSLDAANAYIANGYPTRLERLTESIGKIKAELRKSGFSLYGSEPMKLTVFTKPHGYRGTDFAAELAARGAVCEFADPDFAVMMFSPEQDGEPLERLTDKLLSIPRRVPIADAMPPSPRGHLRVLTPRQAILSPHETLPVGDCLGRILAAPSVSCPPAVPIVVSGERIDSDAIAAFEYYGISSCSVVK